MDGQPVCPPSLFSPLLYLDGAEEEEEEEEERRSLGGEGAALAGGRHSIDVGAAERKHYLCHRSHRVYGGVGVSRGEGRVVGGIQAS